MSNLPMENSLYASIDYWDRRYSNEPIDTQFDWFKSYKELSGIISKFIPDKTLRICILGCGNSTLSQEMYDDGYRSIVNVDASKVLIERMKLKNLELRPLMDCKLSRYQHIKMLLSQNVRELKDLKEQSFDIVIDKGTMDALMCSKGDVWDPPVEVIENCKKEVDEVIRILSPRGKFLYITFGQPHFRKRHLQRPDVWTIETVEIGESFHYYFYCMTKL
ncbi:S-adenosyl-L-methionine-dependent methyltransferase [Phakopsora pachyrhizi]|uniref:S-adenosyl-L-methionine-dependent methyltransferase n=1 Tax=Phakopsora pachyrhizi TaxID=170000 RepID=A0AAV0B2N3_PHAPC|nr:S-adenosyl-L-methionine-dependent methyltransferase [Phakopsora pachyrhizi]